MTEDDIRLSRPGSCEKHGAFEEAGSRVRIGDGPEMDLWHGCRKCAADANAATRAREEREKLEAQRRELETRVGSSRIPARYVGVGFDQFVTTTPEQRRVVTAVTAYADGLAAASGDCLILAGGCGTGKTHLALAAAQRFMGHGRTALYVRVLDLVRMLRSTWHRDSKSTESQVLDQLARVGLLVIDEVGIQYGTDAEQLALTTVIDRRYADRMPMILLTNMEPADFAAAVGERSADRLREVGRWLSLRWPSYRSRA